MTAAHWVYLAGVLVIIGVTVARRNVLVPAVIATAATAWVMTGSPVTAVRAIFNASLTAASELFNIFLIIALVTALLGALRAMGADQRMVRPFQRVMSSGWSAFAVLVAVTYGISLFFWPTPAVPLIGAILVPAAVRAGLPAMGAAMGIAIAGQGMALSSDYVIQVAPGLSATAAGVDGSRVADIALVLSLVTGLVALAATVVVIRRDVRAPAASNLEEWENGVVAPPRPTRRLLRRTPVTSLLRSRSRPSGDGTRPDPGDGSGPGVPAEERVPVGAGVPAGAQDRIGGNVATPSLSAGGGTGPPSSDPPADPPAAPPASDPPGPVTADDPRTVRLAKVFAVAVPVVFAMLVAYMALGKFTALVPGLEGGSAAGLVGGVAALLVVVAVVCLDGPAKALQTTGEHVVDGLVFAFRAMGVVLPIAGFFFLGNAEFAGRILDLEEGQEAPGLLVELVTAAEASIPGNPVVMCFGVLLVGLATGLEGSGFSGLPLTGSLAGALGPTAGMDPATLAAVGQMGSVWAGGGVLVAWSSVLVVAGVTRVPVVELTRKCFVPVMLGLVAAALVAATFF